ncbi:MAG: winged helix-turn-helix transcriptional regulator [Lentisphaeria bacterium]|nr:winged helix-turn-helix transcriptional regulator [Lentisphaeria bacterium]
MADNGESKNGVIIHEALSGILRAGTVLKNATRQFFRNRPTTEVQFNVLMLIKYAENPVTQKELSEWLLVDKSNLTGLVDRMESAGHLKRVKTANDRRSYHLLLTEEAEKLLEELEQPFRELLNSMTGEFTLEELLLITRLMNKLQHALDNRCACSVSTLPRKEK